MSGKLIVIEGLDGSGKATQAKLLGEFLAAQGLDHRLISFPDYAHPSSVLAKMYLDGELGSTDEVNAFAAASFYSVDRYCSFRQHWGQDYHAGKIIVADRYTTSNASHQTGKLPPEQWEAYLDWLADFEYNRLGLPRPNLVVFLDMHPETSRRLLSARYAGDESKRDIHEQDYAYLLQCYKAAQFAAKHWGWQRVACCDGQNPFPPQAIAQQVAKLVQHNLQP